MLGGLSRGDTMPTPDAIRDEQIKELAKRLVALESLLRACNQQEDQMLLAMAIQAAGGLSPQAVSVLQELVERDNHLWSLPYGNTLPYFKPDQEEGS